MTLLETSDSICADVVPLERLEAEIVGWSGDLAAGTARLLGAIAEYDRGKGWLSWGCRSAAHWLSWKCGESLHTAREKVRVARRLEDLPLVAEAFSDGRLSYSKVRAVTRVATSIDDDHWLEVALASTGAELDRIVSAVRSKIDRDENRDARKAFERRGLTRSGRSDGLGQVTLVAPDDVIATVWAAIEALTSHMVDDAVEGSGSTRREVVGERGGLEAMRCDALTQLCEQVVAAAPAATERGDVGRLALVIDTDTLETLAEPDEPSLASGECTLGGVRVAPVVAGRWACDTTVSVMVEHGGNVHDEGRSRRTPNRRLRRALHRRDRGMCRFPGCATSEWLHAHHIVHWANGGPTSLANLVSLCGFHHHLVHDGGWSIALVEDSVIWTDPSGTPATVEPLTGDARSIAALDVPAGTLEPRSSHTHLDFDFVVAVISDTCRQRRAGTPAPSRP